MINQMSLVGRLANDIKVNKTESGKEIATMTLAVPRDYRNSDGIYETDFIDCTLWGETAKRISEYCEKGDMIGMRGRLQSRDNKLEVVADKVSFLTRTKENQTQEIEKQDEKEIEEEMCK